MPHQTIGVAWMIEKEKSRFRGGCLADDMGLGKVGTASSAFYGGLTLFVDLRLFKCACPILASLALNLFFISTGLLLS